MLRISSPRGPEFRHIISCESFPLPCDSWQKSGSVSGSLSLSAFGFLLVLQGRFRPGARPARCARRALWRYRNVITPSCCTRDPRLVHPITGNACVYSIKNYMESREPMLGIRQIADIPFGMGIEGGRPSSGVKGIPAYEWLLLCHRIHLVRANTFHSNENPNGNRNRDCQSNEPYSCIKSVNATVCPGGATTNSSSHRPFSSFLTNALSP
jgi:hypothetical protein